MIENKTRNKLENAEFLLYIWQIYRRGISRCEVYDSHRRALSRPSRPTFATLSRLFSDFFSSVSSQTIFVYFMNYKMCYMFMEMYLWSFCNHFRPQIKKKKLNNKKSSLPAIHPFAALICDITTKWQRFDAPSIGRRVYCVVYSNSCAIVDRQ